MSSKAFRLAAVLVVAVLAAAPGRASASDGSGGETPGPNPGINANAGMPGGFGGGGGSDGCTWDVLNNPPAPNEPGRVVVPPQPTVIGGQDAIQFVRTCAGGANINLVWVVPITGAAAVPGAVADVQRLLPIPNPIMVPPKNDPHGFAYTQVPLWWWLPPSQWQPVSATATASNGPDTVSATVTATPSTINFTAGDGIGSVDCAGPGTPFNDSLTLAAQSTACQYTYHDSSSLSPAGTWPASWSIVWTATWTASDGTGGTLAPLQSTTTRALAVAEDQSVVANPNS
jgi:hypothetical protein